MKSEQENLGPAIQEVKTAMYTIRDLRMFKRYQAILMHLEGWRYREIGNFVGRTEHTVSQYVQNYRRNGLEGLDSDQSFG